MELTRIFTIASFILRRHATGQIGQSFDEPWQNQWHHRDPPPAVSRVRHWAITARPDPSVSLTVSRYTVEGLHPEYVNVSWVNLSVSMSDAWVGLYLADEGITQVVPLKYNFCNASRSANNTNTTGSLSFRILNYRSDLIFRLFRGWERPVFIAESSRIAVRAPGHPTGVRLSLTDAAGEVAITWTSTRAQEEGAAVKYAVLDSDGHIVRSGVARASGMASYTRSELCGAPASAEGFRDPGAFYTAKVKDLEPGSTVSYRVGSDLEGGWSRDFLFRAPPAPGARTKIFAFGDLGEHPRDDSAQGQGEPWYSLPQYAYGDPGVHNTTAAMLADHQSDPADLVLHNGDLSYAMGYGSMWEVFHDNIEPLSTQVPWMVTIGNHERDWPDTNSTSFGSLDSMGECGVPTMRRFAAHPFVSRSRPPNDKPWYTITVGVLSLVAISTEHDIMPGSEQYSWLETSLGAVHRLTTPWLIVAGHRPYAVDSDWIGDQNFSKYLQTSIGNLLETYRVDLVLGGHHHSYQRSCPMRGGCCAESGHTVLNVGMAGAGLNSISPATPPVFQFADDQHFGYCRIVADDVRLIAEYVRSDSRDVYDSVILSKQPGPINFT
ncbi:unnamed protein product [Prorocentrum cordatum]|uniref:Purple acid phosphatase n=1 Tax=Prorocentrum cordatum TaxID=2364126 RepID=A0ABN9UUE7_9DINO|nr:unnamed protein product [Polarella glacialis]